MIRLGNVLVNEALLASVQPCAFDSPGEEGCAIQLSTGAMVVSTATIEEIQRVLERIGLIELTEPRLPEAITLLPSEREELTECSDKGFAYMAKDSDGRVFAYGKRPAKGTFSWLNDDAASSVIRLEGKYAFLSFDDPAPTNIADLLLLLGTAQ